MRTIESVLKLSEHLVIAFVDAVTFGHYFIDEVVYRVTQNIQVLLSVPLLNRFLKAPEKLLMILNLTKVNIIIDKAAVLDSSKKVSTNWP